MLTGVALTEAMAQQKPIAVKANFARRVALAPLFGIKSIPSPFPAEMKVNVPEFLRSSNREYRFNPAGIRTLYLGEGEWTATAETKQHPGLLGFAFEPSVPDVIFHVNVEASAILDLTDEKVISAFSTTRAELLENWRLTSPNAPTQILGKAAFDSGLFEGLRYQSSPMQKTGEEGHCLLLFRDRKKSSSIVSLHDPDKVFTESW
jgi:RES domain-containing protein